MTDTEERPAKPAWLPNPSGEGVRFWDGTTLTDEVRPEPPRTPVAAWVALFLVMGPVWWIAVPFLVDKVIALPDVGLFIGPALSFVTAFPGLLLAFACLDTGARRAQPVGVARIAVGVFALFTVVFIVLFVLVLLHGGSATG